MNPKPLEISGELSPEKRACIERRRTVHHWEKEYRITPRCLSKVFGNAKLCMMIQPLNTRPNYYVVFVDSKTEELNDNKEDLFYDFLENICNEIEEEFGSIDSEGMGNKGFPVANFDSGCKWWYEEYKERRK